MRFARGTRAPASKLRTTALTVSYAPLPDLPELLPAKSSPPNKRCPALSGAARKGVVLRYAVFDAVLPQAFSRAANATLHPKRDRRRP